MAYKDQITRIVDDGIAQGRIQSGMRDQYIQMFTADEQAAEFFASNMLRGQDYTQKTQAVARERQEFERQRQAQLDADAQKRRELEQWEQGARQQLSRAQQLEVELAKARQMMQDYGFEVPPSSTPSPSPSAPQVGSQGSAPTNPNRYLTREEGIGALQELVGLQSQAMTFAGQYQQLFGRPLTDDIIGEALSQNLTPQQARQHWETKYNFQGRSEEMAAQRRAEEEASLRARIREEVLNEVISNPSRVVGGQPQAGAGQGLVFERYSASGSRALQGSGEPGQQGAPADFSQVAPEKRPDLQSSARRVSSAVDFAMRNFTPDGTPRLQGGPAQGS